MQYAQAGIYQVRLDYRTVKPNIKKSLKQNFGQAPQPLKIKT
jgi:hypothetical protein